MVLCIIVFYLFVHKFYTPLSTLIKATKETNRIKKKY